MEFLLLLGFVVGLAFFVNRGLLDYIFIAFLSGTLFFLPVFLGTVSGPYGYPDLVLTYHIYFTYGFLSFSLVLSALIHDGFSNKGNFREAVISMGVEGNNHITHGALFLIIFLALFDFSLLSFSTKRAMMDSAGAKIQIAMPCLIMAALFFSLSGRRIFIIAGIFLSLLSVFIGFRSYFFCFLVVVSVCVYSKRVGSLKNRSALRFVIFSLPVMVFVVLSKRIYAIIKSDAPFSTLFDGGVLEVLARGSEFMNTQYIYQSVINRNYILDIENYLASFLALLPIPQSMFGVSSSYFNEKFQSDIFPNVSYGMAYNPWAEAYSYMGLLGVAVLVLFYCSLIIALQWLFYYFRGRSPSFVISIFLFYVSFYFHRNSLAVEFSFFRNFFYPCILVLFFVFLITKFQKVRSVE